MNDLLDRHDRVMGLGAPLFYDEPIEMVEGEGVWLVDAAGRRYLDLYNNVPCVGHANPRVVEAIARQAGTLNVHSRYLHERVIEYVERLLGLHHDGIESAILACSGTEASEVALMMARGATGKQGIVCTDATYHGNSSLVSTLTFLPRGTPRGPVRSIATPQRYRPLAAGLTEDELCDRHLQELQDTIDALNADGHGFAGMMICSIFANEGLPVAPAGWFQRAADLVRGAGGLLIADEVQAGFARSGRWWGYETSGFDPDIVCMGKPMGNGLPLSGVAAGHDLVSGFRRRHRYFNTFAASPLQAAAGMAVIDEITDRNLVESVAAVGDRIRTRLTEIQPDHPRMGDVRGHGLFIGIDWVRPGTTEPDVDGAAAMVEAMKGRGMLIGKAGQHGNVLKVRPPLVFGDEHAILFLDAFEDAVADAHG